MMHSGPGWQGTCAGLNQPTGWFLRYHWITLYPLSISVAGARYISHHWTPISNTSWLDPLIPTMEAVWISWWSLPNITPSKSLRKPICGWPGTQFAAVNTLRDIFPILDDSNTLIKSEPLRYFKCGWQRARRLLFGSEFDVYQPKYSSTVLFGPKGHPKVSVGKWGSYEKFENLASPFLYAESS